MDEFEPGACTIMMGMLCAEPLRPGLSRGRGNLTFWFSTDEAKGWTQTIYQNLRFRLAKAASKHSTARYEAIDHLRRTCLIESRPTGAIWGNVQQLAEMFQQQSRRSPNSRYEPMASSIKNASPVPDVFGSTINSGSCLAPDM